MNVLMTVTALLFGGLSFFHVSRVLLPGGVGKVAFATSVISYFLLVAQLGIPTYGIRHCAMLRDDKEKLSKAVHEILGINIIMTVITYILLAGAVFFVPKFYEEKELFLVCGLVIFLNAIGTDWLYKALEKYTYIATRTIIFRLLALAGIFLFVKTEADYIWYAAFLVFAGSGYYVLNFINLRKYISLRPKGKYNYRKHFKPILVFFAMSCAITIYTNLDTAMLGFMKGDEETGLYNAAIQLKTMLVSIVCSLGTVMLPRVSSYVSQGKEKEFRQVSEKAIHFMVMISVPMVVFFILFARAGIFLLSGYFFEKAIVPMQIIMPTLLLIGMTNIMGMQMLVPMGKEQYVFYSVLGGAVTDILLNAILIPRYGAVGAAIGTVAAEFVVWVIQFWFLKELVIPAYKKIRYIPILLGAGVGALTGFWFQTLDYNGIYYYIKIGIAGVVYFLLYFGVLLLFRNELVLEGVRDLKRILGRRRK